MTFKQVRVGDLSILFYGSEKGGGMEILELWENGDSVIVSQDEMEQIREHLVGQCEWVLDYPESDTWGTECEQAWSFIDGDPGENHVKYCMFCGRKVVYDLP